MNLSGVMTKLSSLIRYFVSPSIDMYPEKMMIVKIIKMLDMIKSVMTINKIMIEEGADRH